MRRLMSLTSARPRCLHPATNRAVATVARRRIRPPPKRSSPTAAPACAKARGSTSPPTTTSSTNPPSDDGIYWPWDELAECESNSTWDINTGNGYYGGFQFALGSWQSVGGQGYPHEHSPAEQIHRAELLQDAQGWNAWPTCARIIGLL